MKYHTPPDIIIVIIDMYKMEDDDMKKKKEIQLKNEILCPFLNGILFIV